jgi:uncharacterized protein (TIGR02145 family)
MNFNLTIIKKILAITFVIMFLSICLYAQETVTDIDGNVYKTVKIGNQVWMAEDLKTTRYQNGDTILTTNPATLNIMSESVPKYQWAYDGNDSIAAIYGRLYTWYTVTDNRSIAPAGWHVPTYSEWKTLVNFLGGEAAAHAKLKETDTTHWKSPNSDATNESGFTGLPGGSHWDDVFVEIGMSGHYWSATAANSGEAWRLLLNYTYMGANSVLNTGDKKIGWYVRCIKDASTGVDDSKNGKQVPGEIKLNQNYPNPFNPTTTIQYSLIQSSHVKLITFNLLGQRIKTITDSFQNAGEYSIVWDGKDETNMPVSSGIYFYRLETNNMNLQKKMILLR